MVTDCFDDIESAGENYFHNFIIIVINCLCKQIKCYLFLVYDHSSHHRDDDDSSSHDEKEDVAGTSRVVFPADDDEENAKKLNGNILYPC